MLAQTNYFVKRFFSEVCKAAFFVLLFGQGDIKTQKRKGEGLMKIQESAEDYLEAILYLGQTREHVRAIDVVHHLGLSKPSVSVYLKNLRTNGYINVDEKGYLTLTESGMEIASKIYERHETLAHIFMTLGVSKDTAYADACRIEHDLSDETFQALKKHCATLFLQ